MQLFPFLNIKKISFHHCNTNIINIFYETVAATTTTTNRPSPPWLITSQPPVWSTVKPTARPPPPPPKVSVTSSPKSSTTVSTSTQTTSTSYSVPPLPVEPSLEDVSVRTKTVAPQNPPEEITTLPFTTMIPKRITGKF